MEKLIALQKKLHTYKQRREHYLTTNGIKDSSYLRTSKSIYNIQRQIKSLQNKASVIRKASMIVEEFTGYSPTIGHRVPINNLLGSKDKYLARSLFYKYLLENNISGAVIAKYCNTDRHVPADNRRRFTRSFATNRNNLEAWRSFKQYLKNNDYEKVSA